MNTSWRIFFDVKEMKYIRTKDGRIVKINLEGDVFTSRYEIVGEPKDTIEDLCDEFVMINDYCFTKPQIFDLITLEMYKGETIYGAIWTNQGLIYVAKMNEKGEWELL